MSVLFLVDEIFPISSANFHVILCLTTISSIRPIIFNKVQRSQICLYFRKNKYVYLKIQIYLFIFTCIVRWSDSKLGRNKTNIDYFLKSPGKPIVSSIWNNKLMYTSVFYYFFKTHVWSLHFSIECTEVWKLLYFVTWVNWFDSNNSACTYVFFYTQWFFKWQWFFKRQCLFVFFPFYECFSHDLAVTK